MKSWKTTASGLGVILASIGNAISQYAASGVAGIDFAVLIAGLTAGLGLLAAKDSNVTGGTKQQ